MSVNIGPRIGIEGESEYRKQINQIIQETKTLKSEYEKLSSSMEKGKTTLKGNAEQHRVLNEQIERQKERVSELAYMVEQSSAKYGEADQKTLKWKQALNEAETELNKLQQELKELPNQLQLVGDKMQAVGDKIRDAGSHLESFGRSLAPVSTAATGVLVGSAKAAVDFETAMTGVKKTNDELVDSNGNIIISYDDLADSIKKMASETASSKAEIAGVMEAAGQLGVGTQYLSDFTKTMIMLGDSTNLSADEAATAIARFANVTNMSLDNSDKLGAVIVDLGNNFATSEQDIVSMATRLAGAGHQIGLSESEIMGFATALSSVGIEAEMGGSAFSKAMVKMQVAAETGYEPVVELSRKTGMSLRELELLSVNNTSDFKKLADSLGLTATEMKSTITAGNNLNDFAKVAGMNTRDFVELYRKDAPAALQAFISGLGDTEAHGESTIAMLQEMGFTEVRLRDTLTRLANSGNLVTDAVRMGNQAWEENTALTTEAEKKYSTTAAQLSQAKEKLTTLGIEIGERLLPYLNKGLDFLDRLVAAWDELSPETQDAIVKATLLTAAASPVITGTGKLVTGVGSLTSAGGKLVSGVGSLTNLLGGSGGLAASMGSTVTETGLLAGEFGGATAAAGGASTAMAGAGSSIAAIAAPAAAAVAALAVLTGAFVTAYNTDEDFKNEVDTAWAEIKESIVGLIDTVKPMWEKFSKALSPVFTEAMHAIKREIDSLRQFLQGFADFFGGIFSGDWKRTLSGAESIAASIGNRIVSKFEFMRDAVEGIFRNINIELPHIPLPHFNVDWEDKWGLPHFSIDWYAKAMSGGMKLDGATIFGMNNGKLMGGGEVGNEWIVGENSLMNMIRSAVQSSIGYVQTPVGGNNVNVGETTINIYGAPGQDVEELAEQVEMVINARVERMESAWA